MLTKIQLKVQKIFIIRCAKSSRSACDKTRVFPTFSSFYFLTITSFIILPTIYFVLFIRQCSSPRQDLLSSCLSKNIMMKAAATATAGSEVTKAKDKINIKLFLSHDVVDDGGSDIEHSVGVSNGVRIHLIM